MKSKEEEKKAYWNIIDNTLFAAFITGRNNTERSLTFHEWQKDNGVTDSIYNAMEEHFSQQTKPEVIEKVIGILNNSELPTINSILDIYTDALNQIKSL